MWLYHRENGAASMIDWLLDDISTSIYYIPCKQHQLFESGSNNLRKDWFSLYSSIIFYCTVRTNYSSSLSVLPSHRFQLITCNLVDFLIFSPRRQYCCISFGERNWENSTECFQAIHYLGRAQCSSHCVGGRRSRDRILFHMICTALNSSALQLSWWTLNGFLLLGVGRPLTKTLQFLQFFGIIPEKERKYV